MIYTVKKLSKYKTWRILEVQKYWSEKLFWTEIVFKKQSCLKNSKKFLVSLTVKSWLHGSDEIRLRLFSDKMIFYSI